MKKITLLLTSFAILTLLVTAQTQAPRFNENKYRINLPDYWAKGNKVWKILIDKLPVICSELIGKELCGDDCNPGYSVDFYLTEPIIFNYTQKKIIPAPYTDTRQLAATTTRPPLSQAGGVIQTTPEKIYYANNNNIWKLTTEYGFQCFLLLKDNSGKILTRMILVDTNEVWESYRIVNLTSNGNFQYQTPENYVENNKDKLQPVIYDLLAIADKKILSL